MINKIFWGKNVAEYGKWNTKGASHSDATVKKEIAEFQKKLSALQARKSELEQITKKK